MMRFLHILAAFVFIHIANAANNTHESRIVGGTVTTIDKHPYIVQLRDASDNAFCGGTVIAPRFIITAGHCFDHNANARNTFIVGGTGKLKGDGVKRKIKKITVHPEYNLRDYISDLAVIELEQPLVGNFIKAVPLCAQPLQAGQVLQVSGWGSLTETGQMAAQLHTVRLPVTPMSTCRREYGKLVKKNMFCTSLNLAKGHCFGDSGGPAMFKQQLCGVVSFGAKCGMVGFQSAYTSVYSLRGFIRNVIDKSKN